MIDIPEVCSMMIKVLNKKSHGVEKKLIWENRQTVAAKNEQTID